MKALICEMCNSADIIKDGDYYVCQACGMKYTTEAARKMMIEGPVDVSGSTVKIDNSATIQNYLTLAENSLEGEDVDGAVLYAEKVLAQDSENYQAWMIKAKAAGFNSSLANPKIQQSIAAAKKAIEFAPEEEKESVADTITEYICVQILGLLENAKQMNKIRQQSGNPYIKTAIANWTTVLQLPHVSKSEIRKQIGICESMYNQSKSSAAPSERAFYASCITNNSSKPYHITMKNTLLPDEMTEEEKRKAEKSGCYVATAVYGSYDCPQVWTLRRYRDYTLAETWYGRLFIKTYYAISPTLVKWFGHTNWFKKMWKGKLDRMVQNLNAQGVEDTPYEDREW